MAEEKPKRDWLQILASIGVIISVFLLIIQIYNENERELNAHIGNMQSLEKEIDKNREILEQLLSFEGKPCSPYGLFITENLKRSVADGALSNATLKFGLIVRYADLMEYNNVIQMINFPNYDSTSDICQKLRFNVKLFENLKNERPLLEEDKNLINDYINCLQQKRDIKFCNM